MYYDVIISGFGGQGILLIGNVLASAAMSEGKHVSYLPTYGVEMRGGTANCTVVISTEEIGSPIIGKPLSAIIMNTPSLKKFETHLKPGGLLLLNNSLVDLRDVSREEIEMVPVPFNEIASQSGNSKLANMVALGAYVEKTRVIEEASIPDALISSLDERHHHMIPANLEAIRRGRDFIRDQKEDLYGRGKNPCRDESR
jgi:2-oxoglutarate ferredoxin oxidoreductase subunit gamma